MKKKYQVEISLYPQIFTVEAESEREAEELAKKQFDDYNNGKSVYAIEGIEEVTD